MQAHKGTTLKDDADKCITVTICKSSSCPSAARGSNPLTIHCNHCVFSVIFRELARVRPLYDTVNFNCLGLSALTPVQPPEGTRELTERAYWIEWEKATVVRFSSSSSSSMTAHSQLFWHCHVAILILYMCKLFNSYTWQYAIGYMSVLPVFKGIQHDHGAPYGINKHVACSALHSPFDVTQLILYYIYVCWT